MSEERRQERTEVATSAGQCEVGTRSIDSRRGEWVSERETGQGEKRGQGGERRTGEERDWK